MAQLEPEVFDVVIFGASGFTGKHVIREALKFLTPSGTDAASSPLHSLAVAGRSRDRVAAALRWAAAPDPPPEDVHILVADSSDPASLAALAARARVVLSCAGPFRLHGHAVAAACAAAGADCLDISGEPDFIERVEADLHEPAARNGSLIISACGYDSVPADLGFLFHVRQWEPPSVPQSVDVYVNLLSDKRIVFNIGTYESAVLGLYDASQLQALRRSRPRPNVPGNPPPKGPLIERGSGNALGMWAMKLPSADTLVVKRTLSTVTEHPEGLPGAEESPEYTEHRKNFWSSVKPAHFGLKIASRSLVILLSFLCTGLFIGLLGNFAFGRSLLLKYPEFFTLGLFRKTGPTEEEVKSSSFKMWFVGRGFSDAATVQSEPGRKADKEVITRVSGPEVGYITTPIVMVQCALVLLSQRANLPKGGVYTPGVVFGPTDLQQRLKQNGLSFEVMATRALRPS